MLLKKFLILSALSMIGVAGASANCEDSSNFERACCHKKNKNSKCEISRCDRYSDGPDTLGNQRYRRVIVLSQDRQWPGPEVPLDPNHEQALALRNSKGKYLYTREELALIDVAGLIDFRNKYGIDLLAVDANDQGVRSIPGLVTYIPFIIGADKDFFLVEDTAHPERGLSDRWYDVEVGGIILVSANASYTVPQGFIFAGANLVPNSLFSFGEINLIKNNSTEREVFKFTTNWLTLQATDQWGNRAFAISTVVVDKHGRVGNYLAATAILREPDFSVQGYTNYLQERPVITWDCPIEQ